MSQAAAEHPHGLKEPPPEVLLDDFSEEGNSFLLHFWMRLRSGIGGGTVRCELRHRISLLLKEANLCQQPS